MLTVIIALIALYAIFRTYFRVNYLTRSEVLKVVATESKMYRGLGKDEAKLVFTSLAKEINIDLKSRVTCNIDGFAHIFGRTGPIDHKFLMLEEINSILEEEHDIYIQLEPFRANGHGTTIEGIDWKQLNKI